MKNMGDGLGRDQSWPNLIGYFITFSEGMKNFKKLSYNSRHLGQESNSVFSKYEAHCYHSTAFADMNRVGRARRAGFYFGKDWDIHLHATASRPVLGPTQLPI
jgi:hypothetical protein